MERSNVGNNSNPASVLLAQEGMGPQSQRQTSLQQRTYQLAGNNRERSGQQTLLGGVAFDPEKDCVVCKGKLAGKSVHRPHHKLCTNNQRTKGITLAINLAHQKEDKRLQELFNKPLTESEKGSWKHSTKENGEAFFARRENFWVPPQKQQKRIAAESPGGACQPTTMGNFDFCSAVTRSIQDSSFCEKYKNTRAPLAMIAFAKFVVDKIILDGNVNTTNHFDGLTITVPPAPAMYSSSHYHSIVGQRLLWGEWKTMFGIDI
jgi:hypothetical protein